MADPITISSFIDPLYQYGALGIVVAYCLYTDFQTRKENRRIEADRIIREEAADKAAAEREERCNSRVEALEKRQLYELKNLASTVTEVVRELTHLLRDRGVTLKTPLPEVPNDDITPRYNRTNK